MSWSAFKVRLRMKSDMHCGSLAMGFVSRAFPYVPQHLPVFAAVPAAVDALELPPHRSFYAEMEDLLFGGMRATPFFVLTEDKPLLPWNREDREALEADFMSSRYGVALDNASRSARDACLFENEVLLAHRRNSFQSTSLGGFLWLRERETAHLRLDPSTGILLREGDAAVCWKDLLGRLVLGGDRTRNMGRLWPDALMERTDSLWNGVSMSLDGKWPSFVLGAGTPCPVAVAADGNCEGQGGYVILTGRRLKSGAYQMDKNDGRVGRDIGWRPNETVQICLDGLRHATARMASLGESAA